MMPGPVPWERARYVAAASTATPAHLLFIPPSSLLFFVPLGLGGGL